MKHFHNDPHAPTANSIVPAVTVLVQMSGKVLMIRRTDTDLWAMPGGAIEIGETVSMAAQREVREETGLTIAVTGLVGVFSDPAHVIAYDDGEIRQEFSVCVIGVPLEGELIPDMQESKEVAWIDSDQLGALGMTPSMRLRLNAAMSGGTHLT